MPTSNWVKNESWCLIDLTTNLTFYNALYAISVYTHKFRTMVSRVIWKWKIFSSALWPLRENTLCICVCYLKDTNVTSTHPFSILTNHCYTLLSNMHCTHISWPTLIFFFSFSPFVHLPLTYNFCSVSTSIHISIFSCICSTLRVQSGLGYEKSFMVRTYQLLVM